MYLELMAMKSLINRSEVTGVGKIVHEICYSEAPTFKLQTGFLNKCDIGFFLR